MTIGLDWCRDGTLKVKPAHSKTLFLTTNPIFASLRASPHEIQHIIGLWNWALLLRGPVFSVLFHVYISMLESQPYKRRMLTNAVVTDLSVLIDLFHLLYASLTHPLASMVYSSDACTQLVGLV